MHMQLESGRSGKFRNFFQNRGKKFWVPIFILAVAGLGFGVYSAVRAITGSGAATTISIANNYRGYTYDSNAIYYGVNESSDWKPWSTRWYNVNGNDAMCLQASRNTPTGSGTAHINTTDVKRIMLATVPSYSTASVNAGGPNYYALFNSSYNWSSKTSAITNLMTRDTNIVYGSTDSRANVNSSGEEIVKYTDYYYGCTHFYSTSCNKSLAASQVDSRDAIFALGHMAASGIYGSDYYALNSSDISVVQGVISDVNAWFDANYPNAVDEYESYTTWVDATHQTVGWLEYKGPTTYQVRIRKVSSASTSTGLSGAAFRVCEIGSNDSDVNCQGPFSTNSSGYTQYITVGSNLIRWYETTYPSGYTCQSPLATQGTYGYCYGAESISSGDTVVVENTPVPTAYIKIKKVNTENSGVSYAGLTVVGTVFSVKSGGTEVATITIGSDGTGTTNVSLPVGTYTISEKTATTGYQTNSATLTVVLTPGNTATNPATVDMTTNSTACSSGSSPCWFKNEPIKGKVSFSKAGYELGTNNQASSRNLAGISFTAVNKADSSITYTIGPTASDGSVTSPSMVYGNYTATEIRSTANAAYDLLSFDFSVTSTSTSSLGTKTDNIPDNPNLSTVARNSDPAANPQNELEISASAGVTDRITCSGLVAGAQYKLVGELWNGTSDQVKLSPTNNTPVTATVTFTADASGGCTTIPSSDMVFPTFDTSPYIDKTLSIKQYLYKNNGTANDWVRIFIHNPNLTDANQQVKVKNIEVVTTANSERTINDKQLAAGKVKIKDTYEIVGLTHGQTFTLEGTVKDGSGNTVATATDTIVMSLATGAKYTGIMTFEFDSTPYVGQTLYVHQVLKSSSGVTLASHTGTADNGETVTVLMPELITNAASVADGSKELYVGTVDVKDTVTYRGLAPGSTYTIKGELWKLKADGTKDVKVADATDSFTASSEDDTTTGRTLTFTNIDVITRCATDNKLVLPCKFVVFEYIYYGSNNTYFQKHEDVTDTQQIVSVKDPTLESDAYESQNYVFGASTNTKKFALGSVSPIDEIIYSNLVIGQTYNVKSELVYEDGQPVKDKSGNDIVVRESFSATSTNKIVVDSFSKFDSVLDYDYSLGTNQKKYVVFQTLYYGDIELVAHKSLTDTRQTLQIGVPNLHTDARYKTKFGDTSSKFLGVGDVTMIDYVDYEGLVEGEWYMIEGYIWDPETNDIVKINDEYVENSKTFKAGTKGKGTVTLEINLNTISLQGRKFVVYERLYRSPREGQNDSRLLAEHKEALDEGDQTIAVKLAKIETTATDKADGDSVLAHEDGQTIHDVVAYDGLLMGETYTLYGYLWDKTNNQPLLDADGNRIEAYATFTTAIDKDNGTIEMDFPVDAHNLPGVEIVVYEYLFQGEQETIPMGEDDYPDTDQVITKHADPDSVSQNVRVSMRVGTTAADVYDGDQEVGVGKNVHVIDHLKYEGAKMGQKYKAKGWLVYKTASGDHAAGDKAQGVEVTYTTTCEEPAEDTEGGEDDEASEDESEEQAEPECTTTRTTTHYSIEGETTFTIGDEGYEETTGLVPIEFEFDSRELIGQTLVVYEELYLANDDGTEELVAEHKDLDDTDQTINVATPVIHTTATDRADGDQELLYDADVIILDKVEYSGLVKGTTYTLKGQLVDKATGNRISGGVTEVVWTFTPTSDRGYEELDFAINTSGLTGKELVVFETLYIDETTDEEDQIAEHKDLNDQAQTVRVKVDKPNTGLFTHGVEGAIQTGLFIVVIGGLAIGTGIYIVRRKSRKLHGTISFE